MNRAVVLVALLATCGAHRSTDADTLARVLACEAWSSRRDHAAILHTLERRRTLPAHRGADVVEMATRYSTCSRGNARARSIVAGDVAVPHSAYTSAQRWLSGRRVADPCGGRSWHWASPELVREPLDCGSTVNAFAGAR